MATLATAVLYFPGHDKDEGKVSEAQLRLAFSQHSTWNISNILDYALDRRFNFRIMVQCSSPPQHGQPEPYQPLQQEKGGKVQNTRLVEEWRARVNSLLSRPHSRGLAFVGGIEARIAADIGGVAFLDRGRLGPTLTGPSFYTWTTNGVTYYDDDVTQNDVDTLLGVVAPGARQSVNRSLWPSTEDLRDSLQYYDREMEWNDTCEAIFLAIKADVNGPNPVLRTYAKWKRFIQRNGATRKEVRGLDRDVALGTHDSSDCDWHGSLIPSLRR